MTKENQEAKNGSVGGAVGGEEEVLGGEGVEGFKAHFRPATNIEQLRNSGGHEHRRHTEEGSGLPL